ncbi:IclR family transcriptional regulator [Antarcticirhabdus aurantiaca]|uniref:IclR family transcriptional regulator n=1 Tax=Antarcticirhabdus aurantiaca TaxID=2606717 RepID=A0ACD4NTF0_9HYPH|nr:IclR family transcriptional regulator [Antarcticirhabdus aurantiaca]WAJ29907.1 IclR family transcriptional regulator [Jeongeuplla avenae]
MDGGAVRLDEAVSGASASGGAQAVERAFQLLGLVAGGAARGLSLGEAVAGSGLNKPTARRLLLALMRARMVEQDEETRRYRLGPQLYVLGQIASRRHGLLEVSGDALRRLAAATGDTAFLSMRRDDYAVCLHREEGSHPIRTHALQAGDQHPLGVGAGSLAILAALPEAEVEAVLARIEPAIRESYAGYSLDVIREDVAQARNAGVALNPGRVLQNSWGLGRALRFPDGGVAGALSLAAIDGRMGEGRRPELARLLTEEAARIETRLARMFRAGPDDTQAGTARPRRKA